MAKRSVSVVNQTPTGTADTANLADATYPFLLQGGSSTQRTNIIEVYLGGLAGSSAPTPMVLARDSTVASGTNTYGTGQTDAALDASTAALAAPVVTGNSNATTKPQRSSTLHLLTPAFNAYGGLVRWLAAPGEEITLIGNTASLGEISLSCTTGGTPGALSAHAIYETL
jgi:hypothetical protein